MQAFVSRFVHDERHMTFSQPKLLEIYEAKNLQHAHDPLYDAENLMNLFIQVIKRPDITLREFKKNLLTSKDFFIISKPFIDDLCNGKMYLLKISTKPLRITCHDDQISQRKDL